MRVPRLRSSPSIFHPSTNRRMYRFASNGEIGAPCGMPRRLSRASVVYAFLVYIAVATTPAQRLGVCFAHSIQPYQPSLKVCRVGLRIVLFEACSAFTRVAACTLALSPMRDTLDRRLQPLRFLHDCSDCFRLERLPAGACTHWKAQSLVTAHTQLGHAILGGYTVLG